jgi:integrase
MPSLVRYKNGIFYIVSSMNGKRVWRSLRTRDRREAYTLYLNQDPPSKEVTKAVSLKEAQDQYLAYVRTNFSPKTVRVYENIFSRFNEFIKRKPLQEITPRDLDLYKCGRISKVSANTVNHELRGLRAFFNRLILWNILEKTPCQGVKNIRVVETTRPYLTKEDLQKLLEHTKGTQLHDIILFAAMTGMRRGEIVNLTWQDIDWQHQSIVVKSSLTYQTKGGKIRLIPMNSTVKALLEGMSNRSGYLFPGDRGGKYNGNFASQRFRKAIRDCGLDKRLHFHSLRHTFASLLVKEGISLYHVQKLLGHSSPRVTEIYAHLGGAELLCSVETLSVITSASAA